MHQAFNTHSQIELGLDERVRLSALYALNILDTPNEKEFDDLVDLVKTTFECKIALMSIVDEKRQWFKASCGLDRKETAREDSFCAHAVESGDVLVVSDATRDSRFASNPLVLGAPFIRFYAGVPIKVTGADETEFIVGTLCIIDDVPRELDVKDLKSLKGFTQVAESIFALRSSEQAARRHAAAERALVQRIDRQRRQFRQAERMANIGSWRLTLSDKSVEWSDQVFAIHEITDGVQPSLEAALTYYPKVSRDMLAAAIARTVETGIGYEIETDFHTAKGHWRRVRIKGELESIDGTPIALIGVLQDITGRHLMELKLKRDARVDGLTGLPNRLALDEVLKSAMQEARTRHRPLALILIDLDHFKAVNDTFGHAAGDDLLRIIARRLTAPHLKSLFAARLGGDEFVLVASRTEDVANLSPVVERLLTDLHHTVTVGSRSITVSATCGISWLDDDDIAQTELLRRADQALYTAKEKRRGSAHVYGEMERVA